MGAGPTGPAPTIPGPVGFSSVDDRNQHLTVPLARALASLGVAHACITPGSRSTPMTLALVDEPGITDWGHLDERSSAFFALGIGKTTGLPAVVVCTSGTAAAELTPAVVEARYGHVPLIVVTADRPADLLGVGAPQTIDQRHLFGSAVKLAHDLEPPAPGDAAPGYPAALAARLFTAAMEPPAGPVHLNLRFREPLVPQGPPPTGGDVPQVTIGRLTPTEHQVRQASRLLAGRRAILICGPQLDPALPAAAAALADVAGIPVIADPLSQVRAGTHDLSAVVATGNLLALAGWLDRAAPEVVLRVGSLPTSKAIWRWLGEHPELPQVLVGAAEWSDPGASARLMIRADAAATMNAIAGAVAAPAPSAWLDYWHRADQAAANAVEDAVSKLDFPNEPAVVRALAEAVPAGSVLWVSSSMPVRDVDSFFPSLDRPLRFAANRGANGIDGFLSSGLGSAAASGAPTYLLAGDLAVLHDLTALATAARLGISATIVAVNNNGGGIFHFLPQAGLPVFEKHFGTPHGLDLSRLAEDLGVPAVRISERAKLVELLAKPAQGPSLLEVPTDRVQNVEVHQAIAQAVQAALAEI
jgi:2-succinyl-5-enolpyruvyl-6-hydroxy-3-cyclohexene-1-carboxylate synthase